MEKVLQSLTSEEQPLYLLGSADTSGDLAAVHWFDHVELGRCLFAFTSKAEVDRYFAEIDTNQLFLDTLELGGAAPLMEAEGVDALVQIDAAEELEAWLRLLKIHILAVDPGSPRPVKRLYYVD